MGLPGLPDACTSVHLADLPPRQRRGPLLPSSKPHSSEPADLVPAAEGLNLPELPELNPRPSCSQAADLSLVAEGLDLPELDSSARGLNITFWRCVPAGALARQGAWRCANRPAAGSWLSGVLHNPLYPKLWICWAVQGPHALDVVDALPCGGAAVGHAERPARAARPGALCGQL